MKRIKAHINSCLIILKLQIAVCLLFFKYKLVNKKPQVDYLKQLDAVLIQGVYSFAIWKCAGIYRIDVAGFGVFSGNTTKLLLPLTQDTSKIEFKFFGANQVIHKTLQLETTKISVKNQSIRSPVLSNAMAYGNALLPDSSAAILKESLIIESLKREVIIRNMGVKIRGHHFRAELPEFKLSNYEN